MKYAKEVIELMSAYPGREFEMKHLIRYVRPGKISRTTRTALHVSIWRVLNDLKSTNTITANKAENGYSAKYIWNG